MCLGSDPVVAEHLGATVGNFAVVCGFVALHVSAALLYGAVKKIPFRVAAGKVMVPAGTMIIVMYFYQATMTSALFVACYAGDVGMRAIGVSAVLVGLFPIAAGARMTRSDIFNAVWIPKGVATTQVAVPKGDDAPTPVPSGLEGRLLAYLTESQGEWEDADGAEGFCEMFGVLFKDFVAPYQGLLMAEFGLSFCLAVVDFQMTTSAYHCRILNGIVLFLFLLHLAVVMWSKALSKCLAYRLSIASITLQIISAACSFLKSVLENSEDDEEGPLSQVLVSIAEHTILLASTVVFVKTVLNIVVKIIKFRGWRKRKTAKKRLTIFKEDGDEEEGVELERTVATSGRRRSRSPH